MRAGQTYLTTGAFLAQYDRLLVEMPMSCFEEVSQWLHAAAMLALPVLLEKQRRWKLM